MDEVIERLVVAQTEQKLVQIGEEYIPTPHLQTPFRAQPIYKVVKEPIVYKRGKRLPDPSGKTPDPLLIKEIVMYTVDDGSVYYDVFSVGEPGSVPADHDVGFITTISAEDVVRRDVRVLASKTIEEFRQRIQEANEKEAAENAAQMMPDFSGEKLHLGGPEYGTSAPQTP